MNNSSNQSHTKTKVLKIKNTNTMTNPSKL